MYAEIIDTGQRIEVVGFVHHSRITWAVWRDDHGLLFEVPSYAIRMLPNTAEHKAVVDNAYPAPDNWWCAGCASWMDEEMARTHGAPKNLSVTFT